MSASADDGLPQLDPDRGLEVSLDEVGQLLDAGAVPEGVRLIDCREEDEFAICKLPGAELVALSTFAERDFSLLFEKGTVVVVYCHHGMRSAQAAHFLRGKGYGLAFSMAGGIDGWSREIDPAVARY